MIWRDGVSLGDAGVRKYDHKRLKAGFLRDAVVGHATFTGHWRPSSDWMDSYLEIPFKWPGFWRQVLERWFLSWQCCCRALQSQVAEGQVGHITHSPLWTPARLFLQARNSRLRDSGDSERPCSCSSWTGSSQVMVFIEYITDFKETGPFFLLSGFRHNQSIFHELVSVLWDAVKGFYMTEHCILTHFSASSCWRETKAFTFSGELCSVTCQELKSIFSMCHFQKRDGMLLPFESIETTKRDVMYAMRLCCHGIYTP